MLKKDAARVQSELVAVGSVCYCFFFLFIYPKDYADYVYIVYLTNLINFVWRQYGFFYYLFYLTYLALYDKIYLIIQDQNAGILRKLRILIEFLHLITVFS